MFIFTVHWDWRSVWGSLTIIAKFYIFCLVGATAYTTYFLTRIAFCIHHLPKDAVSTGPTRVRHRLIEITRGIENLRQFHTLLFLLFGIFCTNEMIATLRAIRLSWLSLSAAPSAVFEPVLTFAFVVFPILAFLHSFQWIVAARLQSFFTTNLNHL